MILDENARETLHAEASASGLIGWYPDRRNYPERIDAFVAHAVDLLEVVAVTFRPSSGDQGLVNLLRQRFRTNPDFRVRLSLLCPSSIGVEVLAEELSLDVSDLRGNLVAALKLFDDVRAGMPRTQRIRFELSVHRNLPFGSAYLIDADGPAGVMHIETRAPGGGAKDSFGFRVAPPSEFFERQKSAWRKVLDRSVPHGAR